MIEVASYITLMQYMTLITFIGVLIVELVWIKREKRNKYWGYPVVFYSIHAIIYYIAVLTFRTQLLPDSLYNLKLDIIFTSWSTILRFHAGITLLLLGINRVVKIGNMPIVDNTVPLYKLKGVLITAWYQLRRRVLRLIKKNKALHSIVCKELRRKNDRHNE